MNKLYGYARTAHQYWQDPKGRHDLADFAAALAIVSSVAALVTVVMRLFFG